MRTILTWYESAGPFTVPIALVGIAGLLLLTERVVSVVKQSRVRSRPFMERVISLARSDKIDEALRLCSEHQSALPDLGLVLLRSRSQEERDLLHMANATRLSVMPGLTRRLVWPPTLATVAVLVGILGG